MKAELTHKGYKGSVEVSLEDNLLYGKIAGIDDLISYDAKTVMGLKTHFEKTVDEYIRLCKKLNKPLKK